MSINKITEISESKRDNMVNSIYHRASPPERTRIERILDSIIKLSTPRGSEVNFQIK